MAGQWNTEWGESGDGLASPRRCLPPNRVGERGRTLRAPKQAAEGDDVGEGSDLDCLFFFLQVLEQLDQHPSFREPGANLQLPSHGFDKPP